MICPINMILFKGVHSKNEKLIWFKFYNSLVIYNVNKDKFYKIKQVGELNYYNFYV
jgi:hypothetical protein